MLSKKRITLVGILLILVIGGAYSYFRLIVGKRLTPESGANLVPEQASMMTFINTDPAVWSQLNQYGTPEAQALWEENLEQLEQEILPSHEINYEDDIAPWLSGIAIAYLPSLNPFTQDQNFLIIAGITNSLQAGNFLRSLDGSEGTEVTQRQYQGVTITEVETADGDRASGAMVEGYLLFSQRERIIEQAIDTAQGQPSFASEAGMEEILARGLNLDKPAVQVYLNDDQQWFKNPFFNQGSKIIESGVMGFEFQPEGIHSQTLVLSTATDFLTLSPNESHLLTALPERTIAVINGHQLDQVWSQFVERSEKNPFLRTGLSLMRRWARSREIDLDQDVFRWLDGEYAIALFPTTESTLPNLPLAGGILIESSQRDVGEAALSKFGKIAAENPFLEKTTATLGKTQVTTWRDRSEQPVVSYGWLEDKRLMVTLATPFRSFAQPQGKKTFGNSTPFTAMAQRLPDSNLGYIYFNMNQTIPFLESLPQNPLQDISSEGKALLNSTQQMALTVSQPAPSFRQLDLFLSLESTPNESN